MRRPIPAYPQDEFVLRANSTPIVISFFIGNSSVLTYTSGGTEITTNYTSGSYGTISIPADPGTDIVFGGNINNVNALGINSGDVIYISVERALQVPVVPVSNLKTMDLRNMYAAMYSASIEIPNNISTLYAAANTTDQRDICVTYINYSTVTNGVLWIDKTQAYANDVIAAAQAKGWRVYGL